MKRKISTVAVALTLVASIGFTSCIGSFGLTSKVYSWNKSLGDKWINELVFLALYIVPVYEIALFADAVVLNTIEFWTGSNPIAAGDVKKVEGENGIYAIETTENGYDITNEQGQEVSLIFDEESKTWSSVAGDESVKLITIEDESNAVVYLPNGEMQNVELSADGILALRQSLQTIYFASK
ncbi:DUF3332 domain-containing protein [Paludibacter sp. 221]|uniref:DUF3332 domain-containing protein n=1 Tax=Paludibacter sp. 221 TaxID=2302939 RepID=UPI0013D211BC|nr:DUF3332 domain-containing protein [Paludibacter sp. 221]NDV47487.1 DUF3332 domain-containing protein [Paludibacter sp. 221]